MNQLTQQLQQKLTELGTITEELEAYQAGKTVAQEQMNEFTQGELNPKACVTRFLDLPFQIQPVLKGQLHESFVAGYHHYLAQVEDNGR